jgi:hypothetical protein
LHFLSDEKSAFSAHYQQKICCITDHAEVLSTTAQLDREREAMINKHQEALKQFDIGVILQLDQKVSEQQVTFQVHCLQKFYLAFTRNCYFHIKLFYLLSPRHVL